MDRYSDMQHNGLSVAALIFGILAFVTSITVVLIPLFAGLCFTFAFLSRGDGRMGTEAKIGMAFAVAGFIIAAAAAVFAAAYAGRFFISGGHAAFGRMLPYGGMLR